MHIKYIPSGTIFYLIVKNNPIIVHKGSIEKLTGRKASWEDKEPIQLGEFNKF